MLTFHYYHCTLLLFGVPLLLYRYLCVNFDIFPISAGLPSRLRLQS